MMWRKILERTVMFATGVVLLPPIASACDLCALYTALQTESPQSGAIRLSVSEQYTLFDKIQDNGHHVENTANQYLKSSVTQIGAQYDLSDTVAVQGIVPILSRSFRRIEDGMVQHGDESGVGDSSLLLHYIPVRYAENDVAVRLRVFGGVKVPTGDAHRLGEEAGAGMGHDAAGMRQRHMDESQGEETHGDTSAAMPASAIHGHDIALGSGSFDFPVGMGLTTQWSRALANADVQYTMKSDGAYSYRYANDLIWSTSVGGYLYLEDECQVSMRVRFSGQYKGMDTGKGGVEYSDTAYNTQFIGPEVSASIDGVLQGVLGVDLPVNVTNSDLQITPTYRWRAALTYRFS